MDDVRAGLANALAAGLAPARPGTNLAGQECRFDFAGFVDEIACRPARFLAADILRVPPRRGMRYGARMIRSFGDKRTEALFADMFVKEFQGLARSAKRKLEAVNAAATLADLAVPPSNRLEKLRGRLRGYHSIRINDQWRLIFKWIDSHAHAVSIVDYH